MKRFFLLLITLCMLISCGSAYAELSDTDLLSDFDAALRILDENNPFLPVFRQQTLSVCSMPERSIAAVTEGSYRFKMIYKIILFCR